MSRIIVFLLIISSYTSHSQINFQPNYFIDTGRIKSLLISQDTKKYNGYEILLESDLKSLTQLNRIIFSIDSNCNRITAFDDINYLFRKRGFMENGAIENRTYFMVTGEAELLIKYKEKENQLINFVENVQSKNLECAYMISLFPNNEYNAFYYKEKEKDGYFVNDKDLQYFNTFDSLIEYKFGSVDNYIKIHNTRNEVIKEREREKEKLLNKRDLKTTFKLLTSSLP